MRREARGECSRTGTPVGPSSASGGGIGGLGTGDLTQALPEAMNPSLHFQAHDPAAVKAALAGGAAHLEHWVSEPRVEEVPATQGALTVKPRPQVEQAWQTVSWPTWLPLPLPWFLM
jgi:hypothetical protein